MKETKVVIMHNFEREEIYNVMRAVKAVMEGKGEVAFAVTTENSLTMKLGEVVSEVASDHAYMKANPPQKNND
ncbi:MAG: DUF3783 domain-containing protein [Sphaerochaetaceae bacterium]|jgi:hypothetical protein|nr:DUF3783 domain-containing protein [Sphaerochaetaceae bacterium]HHU88634.1 DUF3783 domain-containing protein [Spirochaetales bacterium]